VFQPDDLVSDVLARYPACWDVFLEHGMCEDCRASPPQKPIRHFVQVHCGGDLTGFLAQLEAAARAQP
jgi:hypothetical protein